MPDPHPSLAVEGREPVITRARLGRWMAAFSVSLFVSYHLLALLVHNMPSDGALHEVRDLFRTSLGSDKYMRSIGARQRWSMFSPNPARANAHVVVLVKTADGKTWDLAVDSRGRRRYPYLFYDRMGKINRRLAKSKHYQKHIAAWACREWERRRGGEVAESVELHKVVARIPAPRRHIDNARGDWRRLGFDPAALRTRSELLHRSTCRGAIEAQLSPELRARYGLPAAKPTHHRPIRSKSWKAQQDAEERRAQRLREKQIRAAVGDGTRLQAIRSAVVDGAPDAREQDVP